MVDVCYMSRKLIFNIDGRQTRYVDLEAGMGGTGRKSFGQARCKVVYPSKIEKDIQYTI